jgi:hypothetical protein
MPYGSGMGRSQPQLPNPDDHPKPPAAPRVGKVSEFLGSRLLLLGLFTGALGFACLLYAAFKVWQVVSRGSLGSEVVPIVAFGGLAFALLSIGGSARRTGLRYLRGHSAVSSDLMRFFVRRMDRRRQARGR